ncbi:type III pantothenate kinase [Thiohalospira halophila DSM 15071]|uniref:Type III pantothenate kinase n=1 Tax=Thiohalospira halophila DSM 15071 TaxID=1123397 RepID=A0A1I1UT57_9GAMM|nr:type III pantothenate kinase [Thiohalospira halophila]SFD73869.1 type III pantothenate kinase [Thiohalospira halophila DSM 15071]
MDWVVDAGNSRLRWAAVRAGRIHWQVAVPTADPTEVEAAWARAKAPYRILVGAVAGPDVRETIRSTAHAAWQREPELLRSPGFGWGVRNGYREPGQLGIDRFAALVAANRRAPAGSVVVDIGTAVTVDVLIAGEHRGGYILPGLDLMARSLASGTAAVDTAAPDPETAVGRDTPSAVGRGIVHAVVGAVAEIRAHLAAQGLSGVPCFLTGGGALLVAERIAPPRDLLPGLVLEGLAQMAAEPMD